MIGLGLVLPQARRPIAAPNALAGLLGWWRADLVTLVSSAVSVWPDKSGNGRDLAQATASKRPTVSASSIGSQPALLFDGVDDGLVASASSLNFERTDAWTVVAVAKSLTDPSAYTDDAMLVSKGDGVGLLESTTREVEYPGRVDMFGSAQATNAFELWVLTNSGRARGLVA